MNVKDNKIQLKPTNEKLKRKKQRGIENLKSAWEANKKSIKLKEEDSGKRTEIIGGSGQSNGEREE